MGTYRIQTEDGEYEVVVEDAPIPQASAASRFLEEATGGPGDALSKVGQIGYDVVASPFRAAKGLYDLGSAIESNPDALKYRSMPLGLGAVPAAVETIYSGVDSVPEAVVRTGELAAGIPLIGPGIRAATDYLAGEVKPAEEYGREFREGVASVPGAMAVSALPKIAKGSTQIVGDALLGKPKRALLEGQADYPEAYANQLNLGESTIPREKGMTTEFMERNKAFERLDPMQGIDLNSPNGRAQMDKFVSNLNNKAIEASQTRNSILKNAALAESQKVGAIQGIDAPVKAGVAFRDIPANTPSPSGTTFGVDRIRLTNPRGAEGIDNALAFVKEKFGVSDLTPEGRPLSVAELDDVRQALDGQLRALGEYDPSVPNLAINPSDVAGEIEVFKHYAGQVREALKNRVSDLAGADAAAKLTSAAEEYDAAINFANLAERFKTETGQAFTAGSAKKVPKGQSILGGKAGAIADSLIPGRAESKVVERGLSREGEALRNLNTLLEINRLGAKPIPRGWALIKSSAPSLAQVENLALGMGVVTQAGELAAMPDDVAQKVIGAVAAANPQMFESNPDMANVIDDKFQDPMSRDRVVMSSMDLEPRERAMRIGASFANKYVPPTAPMTPMQAPTPALPATLSRLSENVNSVFRPNAPAQDYSYDKSNGISELERLTNGN